MTYRAVGDLDTLGSGVQLTVYRIVQKALTNTLKHAGTCTSAEVTVAAEAGTLGSGSLTREHHRGPVHAEPEPRSGGTGHGLIGNRQRSAMYGGDVTIGPRDTGHGWTVDIVLDVPTTPAPPTSREGLP